MAIQAARRASRCGGGYRLWVFGKALDVSGTGRVCREDLRAYMIAAGLNPRTWQRWIIEARNNDFVSDVQNSAGEWILILHSAARVARSMGLETVGPRARIAAGELLGNGWKGRVTAAWEDGKQISREQIQKSINLSVRTQVYRDRQAGTLRTRNYSKSEIKADNLTVIKEHGSHRAPFVTRDGFIAWRLPDTRQAASAQRVGQGRARKINKTIRSDSKGLSNMRRALARDRKSGDFVRLFNSTEAQRKSAERQINKHDLRVADLYQRAGKANTGAMLWAHYPAGGRK